jgi:hypothetical protein
MTEKQLKGYTRQMSAIIEGWWTVNDLNNPKVSRWVARAFERRPFDPKERVKNWATEECGILRRGIREPQFAWMIKGEIADAIRGEKVAYYQVQLRSMGLHRLILDDIKGYAKVKENRIRIESQILAMDRLPQEDGIDFTEIVAIRRRH